MQIYKVDVIIVDMESAQLQNFLSGLDFTDKQVKIFVELSKHIDSTALALSKTLSIPRTSVYLELERLKSKGYIISNRINRSTRYKIVNPQTIKARLSKDFSTMINSFNYLDQFAKQIEENQSKFHELYSINVYKKQDGVKQLLWNILTSGAKELVGFSPGTLDDVVDREFAENWRLEFMKRKMFNKIIINDYIPLTWSDIPNFLSEFVEARTLNKEKIHFDRELLIYIDTLVIISKKDDPEQYGIEIKDRLLVGSYKQIFNFLWENVAEKVN